ncbi:MAG: DUF1616 domain-containing protein [Candidatus Hodarchaeota archaeon]
MRIEIREKPWDLVTVMVLATLLLGIALTAQTGTLRIVLGLPFVLFLPGYVIVSALVPKDKDLDTIERIALSFGLSIAVVPFIGLSLNYTPWGIRLNSILLSLFVLIISVSIIAWYRRSQVSVEDRFCFIVSIELPRGEEFAVIDKLLTILLVVTVIIAVCTLFYVITSPKKGESYTEFYILNENKITENYPTNLTISENGTVIVNVVCREHERTKYTVVIELINLTGERENKTLGQYNFTLGQNQRNETVFNFNISDNGTYKLQFLLYINDIKEEYRELHLWINVKP